MPSKNKKTALVPAENKPVTHWRGSAALQRVFETIPRDEIIQALLDSGDDKAVRLAERLSDGEHSRANLARHCAAVQILPKEVWSILIDSRKLATRLKVSERLVEVAEAVIDAAVPAKVECPRCQGVGEVASKDGESNECGLCGGSGQVVRPGDRESQKMALEIGEILGQKGPMNQFNILNAGRGGQVGVDMGPPDMADWSRRTDSIFEEHGSQVIEAQVVPGKENE